MSQVCPVHFLVLRDGRCPFEGCQYSITGSQFEVAKDQTMYRTQGAKTRTVVVRQRQQLDNYDEAVEQQIRKATEAVHAYLERGYISAEVHDGAVEALENAGRLLTNDF